MEFRSRDEYETWYTIMENDLPRSGIWFVEECRRRMAATEAEWRSNPGNKLE